jgi:ABC-type nitrate/sulfonate/bicarbonate transport system ATPase subunit
LSAAPATYTHLSDLLVALHLGDVFERVDSALDAATMIERFPLERAAEAYERMMSGGARFRVVLETGA